MASEEAKENGAEAPGYSADLLPKMIPFLDRHLIFPLVADRERTPEVVKFLYSLLKPTYMTDYVGRLHKEMENLEDTPAQYDDLRDDVLKKKEEIEEKTAKIREVLANEEIIGNLRSDKISNMNYLKEYGVTEETVADLWDYGQFHYNCGNYQDAAQALQGFRVLVCICFNHWDYTDDSSLRITIKFRQQCGDVSPLRFSAQSGILHSRKS
jgi:translation initiation factor 3 subunit E